MKPPADIDEACNDSDNDRAPAEDELTQVVAEHGSDDDGDGGDGSDGDATDGGEDAEDDAAAPDSGDEPADQDEPAGPRRRRSAAKWFAAVVLVAVLAASGYAGWLLFEQHQKDVAAAEALDAAEKFTLVLTTINPHAIDQNITEVRDGSTGEFKNLYEQSSAQLRQVLIDNKATAHGVVIESAVKSASKDRVEVVLFVDQAVSNAAAPAPQLDRSRVVMTMEKVDGRWLASKVDLP